MNKEMLSTSETLIMKAIWDVGEDITITELIELMRVRFGKDYKRTTVATFLIRLSDKRFISTYRVGRLSYVHAEKTQAEYEQKIAARDVEFWFKGKAAGFLAALCNVKDLDKEDISQIKEILDGLDD